MEDLDVRQALRDYVQAGEPPLSVSSTALLAIGRRRRRWRTGLAMSGGTLATVIALAGALTLNGARPDVSPGDRLDAQDACASGPAVRETPGLPGPLFEPTSRPSADPTVVARLNCYIARTVTALLPDATFAPDQHLRPLVIYPDGPADRINYSASAIVIDAAGRGSLLFMIFPQEQPTPSAAEITSDGHSVRTGPRGEMISVDDAAPPTDLPNSGIAWHRVYVYTGKTVVSVWASNDGSPRREPIATAPTRSTPPLTVDQLIAIATDPELAVYG